MGDESLFLQVSKSHGCGLVISCVSSVSFISIVTKFSIGTLNVAQSDFFSVYPAFQPTRDPLEFSVPSNRLRSVSSNSNSSRSERRAVPYTSNPTHFRDHLNSGLDLLRWSSPLVPEFEDVEREAGLAHSMLRGFPELFPTLPCCL
jgi:hypothetical protein